MFDGKIFCVGMNKTGTTTIARCLATLGVEPLANPSNLRSRLGPILMSILDREDYEPALALAAEFRGFKDLPWNVWRMPELLDQRFPGSRFILTERDPGSWWTSIHHWITVANPESARTTLRHLRVPEIDRDAMIAAYLAYNDEVKRRFAASGRLLVVDLERGDGWEPICDFLEAAVPEVAFPHANRQEYSEADRTSVVARRTRTAGWACLACGDRTVPTPAGGNGLDANASTRTLGAALDRLALAARNVPDRRRPRPASPPAGFAAVTCLFNPCGFRSRLRNFHRFREAMALSRVPLLTVELAIGEQRHEVGDGHGEVLRLRARDALWHKERLLNLGIARLLDRGFEKIAWLDADVLFDDPYRWAWRVADELDRSMLCQAFSIHRGAMQAIGAVRHARLSGRPSQRTVGPGLRHPLGLPLGRSGFAWAARAELLRQVPLYDGAIIGGADRIMLRAGLPRTASPADRWETDLRDALESQHACGKCGHRNGSPAFTAHALDWARRWSEAIGGRMGFVHQAIVDLEHGPRERRAYLARHEILFRHGFDPARDLIADGNGCWQWTSDKPALHGEVLDYFRSRREDG